MYWDASLLHSSNQYICNYHYFFLAQHYLQLMFERQFQVGKDSDLAPYALHSINYAAIKKNGYQIQKIINKVQRILTKSDWLFFHGVNNDPVQFQSYINKIGKSIAL